MKLKFDEHGDDTVTISIDPETPEEVAMLLRLTVNAKKESPQIYFNFGSKPNCSIYFSKKNALNRRSSIGPHTQIK